MTSNYFAHGPIGRTTT